MKITAGIAACALLACSIPAFADTSPKPLYKQNGELCSTDEASGKVKDKSSGRSWRIMCRTELDWHLDRTKRADRELDQERLRVRRAGGEQISPFRPYS